MTTEPSVPEDRRLLPKTKESISPGGSACIWRSSSYTLTSCHAPKRRQQVRQEEQEGDSPVVPKQCYQIPST